jgi:hypothetical protein
MVLYGGWKIEEMQDAEEGLSMVEKRRNGGAEVSIGT